MKLRWLIPLLSVGLALAAVSVWRAQSKVKMNYDGPVVANFTLLDNHGEFFELYRHAHAKAIVLISHGIGCPILQKNIPVIHALRDKFKPDGVKFFFINANTQDDHQSLAEDVKKFSVNIPVLVDRSQTVTASLGITRQSEAVVIDPATWKIVYQGMIDDSLDYGIEKAQASHRYLSHAVESLLAGRKIEVTRTQTLGCAITFEQTPEPVTYSEHIAPIVTEKCLTCHVEGGAQPNNLEGYKQVRGWAAMIKEVIRTNRMPPWELDPNVGQFQNNRSLTDQEIRLITKWVDSGMLEGQPQPQKDSGAKSAISFKTDRVLNGVKDIDIPPRMAKPWIYTTLIENQPQDEWYSSFLLDLSNRPILQHIAILILSKCLDPADQGFEPHYRMREGKILNILRSPPLTRQPFYLPAGVAFKIPKGACVVLEQHFVSTGKPEKFSSAVLLQKYAGKKPPKDYAYEWIGRGKFEIPPHQEKFVISAARKIEQDTHLYQLAVHMHKRGQSMKLEAVQPDGRRDLLFSVPHFLWQHRLGYTFANPIPVKAGTVLEATAVFNNSATNPYNPDPSRTVPRGADMDTQEMMVMHVYRY